VCPLALSQYVAVTERVELSIGEERALKLIGRVGPVLCLVLLFTVSWWVFLAVVVFELAVLSGITTFLARRHRRPWLPTFKQIFLGLGRPASE
jgi:hypothetical protein